MEKIANIATDKLLKWDEYKAKAPDEILLAVYSHVEATSLKMTGWYWKSIKAKRRTSVGARSAAFVLLILGTTFPIFAALERVAEYKLLLTQLAVAFLAIAGLTQVADRAFGWSSGWMRYITTVTTMENLIRAFQMEWAKYLVSRSGALNSSDAKVLFDLGHDLEKELTKLQADETTTWIAEFNTGITLLESLIKSQREETDKKLDAIRTSLVAKQASAAAEEKERLTGSLEVRINHKGQAKQVKISLDEDALVECAGPVWAKINVNSGHHVLNILNSDGDTVWLRRVVEIKPGEIATLDVAVGN